MRSYINVWAEIELSDVLDEIDNETLKKEVKDRGLMFQKSINIRPVEDYRIGEFRRILCDMLSLGYRVSDDEIVARIRENL